VSRSKPVGNMVGNTVALMARKEVCVGVLATSSALRAAGLGEVWTPILPVEPR
jgi:hypothetical protein